MPWSIIGLGPLSYVPLADHGENNLPARLATALAWRDGGIGFWFPQALMGADRLAMGLPEQNRSPALLLLPAGWPRPDPVGPGFVAGSMHRLLAGQVRARRPACRLPAGSSTAFSQPAINQQWAGFSPYDGLALPALPLVLWALGRILDQGEPKGILIAALLGAGYSLASHFFYTVFILPLVLLWFPLVGTPFKGLWLVLAAFLLGWLTVEAPFLWASAASAPFGHRKHWAAQHFLSGSGATLWLQAVDLASALLRTNLPILIPAVVGLVRHPGQGPSPARACWRLRGVPCLRRL